MFRVYIIHLGWGNAGTCQGMYVEAGGQLAGDSSLFLPYEFQESIQVFRFGDKHLSPLTGSCIMCFLKSTDTIKVEFLNPQAIHIANLLTIFMLTFLEFKRDLGGCLKYSPVAIIYPHTIGYLLNQASMY